MSIKVQLIANANLLNLDTANSFEVSSHTQNDIKALRYAIEQKPDVIILQYDNKCRDTLQFINAVFLETSTCKIILVGDALAEAVVLKCIMAGCCGYLEFDVLEQFLIKAVNSVYNGEAWISRKMVAQIIEKFRG